MRSQMWKALAVATAAVLSGPDFAAAAAAPKPLFASDGVISLTLRGPLANISRSASAKPVAGLLTVTGAAPESLPVALSARGITRRSYDTCSFPPLRVEFTQKPAATSVFRGQKRLKLVTHCQQRENHQEHILLEYAAYRLYAALTPESFGARLAKIDYLNDSGRVIASRFGFFIEDVDDVARRNGRVRLRDVNRISSSQLEPAAAARFAVFQYMIGNLDWSMIAGAKGEDCCHNARLLGMKGATSALIPTPYDFDFSGLVNAPYALPPEKIPVATVRERHYRGLCRDNAQAKTFAAQWAARRTALTGVLQTIPQIDDDARRGAIRYLDAFFDQAGSPEQVAKFLKTCSG